MRRFSNPILLGAGLLLVSLTANAQIFGRNPQRDDPYHDRNGRYSDYGQYGQYGNGRSLINQVMSDINRAASNARRLDGHEAKHFDEAARKLQDFQYRLDQGRFDTGKLDKAIENLQHLANADQIRGRDRDILAQDLSALRQFRSNR